MAVAECVAPISRLWRDLSKGRAFPGCDMASGPGGRSYARPGTSYYDLCPTGSTALGSGHYAAQGTAAGVRAYYAGIGSGDNLRPGSSSRDDYQPLPAKVCVSHYLGQRQLTLSHGEGSETTIPISMFERVVVMDAQGSPRVVDVFIDDQLYRRVRW
jgi:hypothetical protein